jgi:hypothetical protein
MQRGPCAKCGSSDIHYGIPLGDHMRRLISRIFSAQTLTYYVCCSCGNVEIAVESIVERAQIARNWPKIDAGQSGALDVGACIP